MKKYLILFLAPFFLLSCGNNRFSNNVREVPACNPLLRTQWSHEVELWTGTLREETLWIDTDTTTTPVSREAITLWILLPDEAPDQIFAPCNLPAAQMIPGRRVVFSAHVLTEHEHVPEIEGILPISIIEMEDGVEGPYEDDDDY